MGGPMHAEVYYNQTIKNPYFIKFEWLGLISRVHQVMLTAIHYALPIIGEDMESNNFQ